MRAKFSAFSYPDREHGRVINFTLFYIADGQSFRRETSQNLNDLLDAFEFDLDVVDSPDSTYEVWISTGVPEAQEEYGNALSSFFSRLEEEYRVKFVYVR